MLITANPRQLVLRRDTANGLTLVGWDEDLPIGRFEHLDLVCESDSYCLPGADSEDYAAYQQALGVAREANTRIIDEQIKYCHTKGWYPVSFELAPSTKILKADRVGNYSDAAMKLYYQLTGNCRQAWAVMIESNIIHVRARFPKKELDSFTYQVWYHKQIHDLTALGGQLTEGQLIILESGLWFEVNDDHSL